MKYIFTLIAMLFVCNVSIAQSFEVKCQAIIDSVYASKPASVGILVHVESPNNGISWSGASGHASKESNLPLTPDVPALIASNIKTYVSATILRLVENGRLTIEQPIKRLLTNKTRKLFINRGYDLDSIRVKHLLSHTSGIENYANQEYLTFIDKNKQYRWTRNKQLELTIKTGPPLGMPGFTFSYSDANYLLLTEIIESFTRDEFFTAMRKLLRYSEMGLTDTWMPTLEMKPKATKAIAHQYWSKYNWDTYDIDVSVDLYGGGGIACTTKDLASFNYKLFNGEIVKDTSVLNLIYTHVKSQDENQSNYLLGISSNQYGYESYGHGGFWGTTVAYFPKLDASVSIYILERDEAGLRGELMHLIVGLLGKEASNE